MAPPAVKSPSPVSAGSDTLFLYLQVPQRHHAMMGLSAPGFSPDSHFFSFFQIVSDVLGYKSRGQVFLLPDGTHKELTLPFLANDKLQGIVLPRYLTSTAKNPHSITCPDLDLWDCWDLCSL